MGNRKQHIVLLVACLVCFLLGKNFGTLPTRNNLNAKPSSPNSLPKMPSGYQKDADGGHTENGMQPSKGKQRQETCPPTQSPSVHRDSSDEESAADQKKNPHWGSSGNGESECMQKTKEHYTDYFKFSEESTKLREEHGTLRIAAFSRLWVPPLHGKGGMQYHALHLYSQLAAKGHLVHVFVTGGPGSKRVLYFNVDQNTLEAKEVHPTGSGCEDCKLVVHAVPSDKNGEYSETWFHNCLEEFTRLNNTLKGGFQVAHSESWAGVANTFQIGLQMAVTWHGSMLDWFRNEINLIVHNYRMKGKMTGQHTASRMNSLGTSVAYEAYMLLTVPHHIVISDSAADDLKEINLVDKERIHLIYNGVNPKNFQPNPSVRNDWLAAHDVDPNFFVVGCGGRLDGIKGHHQLSKAMEIVLKQRKNVALLVAGSGGEGHRYEALKKQGLNVVMLGMLNQQDLAKFYQSLDVFVDPFYQHHGLNTVMIEAVLSGTPIIATDLASAKTTAPCEDFGRTFGLGEVQQLVKQILYYQDHPGEKKQVGKNVRDRATHLFSSTIMAGTYESLLYKMYLNPLPLEPVTGKVVCKHTYPAMCYREPHDKLDEQKK